MSEPETAAGRALLEAFFEGGWAMPTDPGAAIAAIETEARAAADAQLVRYSGIIGVIEHANAQGLTVHVATRGTCAAHIEAGDDTSEPVRADAALVAEKAVSRALAGAAITNAKELAAEKERVARLRAMLELKPYGTVGPEEVPWFRHGGISHGEGAECVVCALLAETADPAGPRWPSGPDAERELFAALSGYDLDRHSAVPAILAALQEKRDPGE